MMNQEDLQKQIDVRCSYYPRPMKECDCQTEDSFYTKDLLEDAVVVQLPKSPERPVIPPKKPASFT